MHSRSTMHSPRARSMHTLESTYSCMHWRAKSMHSDQGAPLSSSNAPTNSIKQAREHHGTDTTDHGPEKGENRTF